MNYKLELKQIVEFPRCRIYRDFIQTLITTKSIRTTGGSFLFYYLVLCSYANYRTSYRRMEHITYTIGPGEWICTVTDLQEWFRCRFQHQALSILRFFEEQNYITYSLLGKNRLVKFKISDWPKDNTVLEYNYPCKKDTGFFFFPIAKVHELIGIGKCSEMDVILDLWIHAVYNDSSVLGSDSGPIVYYRDNTGNPLTSFNELGERWSLSKASVSRLLKKLEEKEYITLISFTGKHGSVIYLNNYLSVMFNISDVMIDKEEIAMKMQLPIHVPEEITIEDSASVSVSETVTDSQITVVHFASKKAMNIEGLSEATLEKFLNLGYLHSFQDIYHLEEHREDIVALDGYGEKSFDRLWESINASRRTSFVRYLVSMDIPMIGRTKSRILDTVFSGNLTAFEQAAVGDYDFTQLEDFGEILNHNIHSWFADEANLDLWKNLQNEFTFEQRKEETIMTKENKFTGCTIVATGKLEHFTRDGINDKILELGAKPGSSVTKKTDYLICGEKAGSKLAKAQSLGIPILTEAEFLEMIA